MFSKQLFHACMAISSATTFGAIEFFNQRKFGSTMLCNHHLSNAFAVVNHEIFVRKVHQQHHQLASIIGINGSWCVQNSYSMLQAKPLLGRTCASTPGGSAINKPVGTRVLSSGRNTMGWSMLALRSIPALSLVAYCGRACLLLLMICISVAILSDFITFAKRLFLFRCCPRLL